MNRHENTVAIQTCVERFRELTGEGPDGGTTFLDLQFSGVNAVRLLLLGNFDFLHDMRGIRSHINRDTFQLEDCFVPRAGLAFFYCPQCRDMKPIDEKCKDSKYGHICIDCASMDAIDRHEAEVM